MGGWVGEFIYWAAAWEEEEARTPTIPRYPGPTTRHSMWAGGWVGGWVDELIESDSFFLSW